jgi:hypothetical protein
MVNQPRLDARDEAKEERALPFVGPLESIGSDTFVKKLSMADNIDIPSMMTSATGACARTGAVRDLTS